MIALDLQNVEYSDEYSTRLQTQRDITMSEIVAAANQMEFPFWIRALFWIRDSVMQWFQIKTRSDLPADETRTSTLGLFPILRGTPEEIIAGVDDRHLNFRVVVTLSKKEDGFQRLSFRTLVQFNNTLGRIYFLPVKPLHRIIVPFMLKKFSEKVLGGELINSGFQSRSN
jgi:hypothetical protein